MSMRVTLRQLRAFVKVVEEGSFSDAAKAMHLSQAALSGLVKELEERVGVRLLDRHTRAVVPSAVGTSFEPMARRVLASLDEALEGLASIKALRRGLVRVAAPEPLSCTLLPELIARYNERHPAVDVHFEDVPMERVLAGVADGSTDIGFGPARSVPCSGVEVHGLRSDPLCVALPADDPLAGGEAVRWSELRDRPLINFMPHFAATILAQVPERHHPRELVPVHRVNTALSLLRVRSGAVVCPALTAPLVQGFGLRLLPLVEPEVNWKVALFVRTGNALSPAVQSFLERALEQREETT